MLQELTNNAYALWIAFDMQIRTALIGAAATLLAASIAALVVAWQVRAQARNAIAQSEKNEATKLKLQIYERILMICAQASDANLNLKSFVRLFSMSLRRLQIAKENGWPIRLPDERYAEFARLRSEAQMKAIAVTTSVESWTIVDPRMVIFQTANSAALDDLRNTTDGYFRAAMKLFPAPMPDDPMKLFPWDVPSEADIVVLEEAAEAVTDAADTLMCYIHDFRVEMQKNLVGSLFPKGHVPTRMPLDPKHIVISLDNHKKLTRYFENKTAWGANNKRVRDDVAAQVAAASKRPPSKGQNDAG